MTVFTKIAFTVLELTALPALATAAPSDFPRHGSHYMINDTAVRIGNSKTQVIDLTDWVRKARDMPATSKPYNRTQQFGKWIDDPTDRTCFNTRGKVLERDSSSEVYVSAENECLVAEGRWKDPYTNGTLTLAADVQVDHMVPLKNAFISGAWQWTQKKRCAYTNFMGNSFHLLSVDATENMSKSDQAPDEYLPSNKRYICTYLMNWLKVKAIWSLKLTPPETEAIKNAIADYNCKIDSFVLPKSELTRQRTKIKDFEKVCERVLRFSKPTAEEELPTEI